jgi:drug/metabolite transporter (DMT)-like permease
MKTLEVEPISKLMMARKILLVCGILSSLLYVAMNVIAAMLYEGYNSTSQMVSELSATGAVAALWRRRLFFRILPAYGVVIAAGILMLVYHYFAF